MMLFRPLKHGKQAVSPPAEVRRLSEQLFGEVMEDYAGRWQQLKAAAKSSNGTGPLNVLNDPWWARESWRWDPFYSTGNMLKRAFPGLKVATGLFVAYLAYDWVQQRGSRAEAKGQEQ